MVHKKYPKEEVVKHLQSDMKKWKSLEKLAKEEYEEDKKLIEMVK